jgi:RNA polymerase sigma-70 factor (ECF subfamily)
MIMTQTEMRPAVQGDASALAGFLSLTGKGDRAAFRLLYDATSRRLYGVILKIVRDPGASQEALQDVYLRIWQRAGSYRSELGDPLAWMIAIARNRAIDEVRARRRTGLESSEDVELSAELAQGPVDLSSRDALSHCLDRLEPQQRACIILAYVHGYSREELASRFDRPVNTIKTWLHRSLASLKSCMERA